MPFDPVSASVKPSLDLLKAGIGFIRRQFGKRKADEITSSVIAELLKESPDVTAAEAQLAAIAATGVKPTIEFHRAKQMLGAVRRTKFRAAKKGSRTKVHFAVGARKKTSRKKVSKGHSARAYRKLSARKRRSR
jgi:hypothetical protein